MSVFINRTINLKKIKAIGFDMDYTIVRYNTKAFEEMAFSETLKILVANFDYPKEILSLSFDYNRSIQGLVIDKKRGMILKVSRYSKVKKAFQGHQELEFRKMQNIYRNRVIDLTEHNFQSLDTSFSISNGVLYAGLVELKQKGLSLPNFYMLADDIKESLDICHSNGSLKGEVKKNIQKFIIQDADIAQLLEKYKEAGKKLLVITNSDYEYSKLLLDYTINPFLTRYKNWSEVFDITITSARKPAYFTSKSPLLAIQDNQGLMKNHMGKISSGIYQGGWAGQLQDDLNLEGDEILYLGDHIYGDVVSLKKTFNWRTALILDPLEEEITRNLKSQPIQNEIDALMLKKEEVEHTINTEKKSKETVSKNNYAQIENINKEISNLINLYQQLYNPYWGEMMRAGQEESRFADQVEKYACLYMTKISDLLNQSPNTYFRPRKRILPHEQL